MALIGFARVSTQKQDLRDQLEQLQKAGCEKIFKGKNSGKKENNAERLAELRAYIREGDTVVVTKIDRLGRSVLQILSVLEELQERKIYFKSLDGIIDTENRNDPCSIALIRLVSVFAELDRNFIVTRMREGKLAKGEAGIGGRPKKLTGEILNKFKRDLKQGKSLSKLSKKYGVSIATASRARRKILAEKS
ncbi:recombinase family protein [Bisgaard Taxon 10/6]|uniref:recombinase family protein n=1 Tax=Exercitatus varius TaxID=67857 RepID=UPI00294B70FF|nr:recombinase family protein [Exercitatus varius]MDG2957144.1 recombinase family protein [Exercitatus varius]MDG2965413.1 recombinase family protein [Exercitatus varius]